ncbi:endonuclease [Neptunomonas phycophila]|uniref:Endonuclease n=1 Tax=Neptunomonas phycophila TaxID=1572645 RepID=A0ABT9ET84_9GAMM|nr:endonuclease/exonuclease/phosphatase family protein [Neptunomonas phycophila]MDP2522281.1 endonuclease [Neptunomonas phycophila]
MKLATFNLYQFAAPPYYWYELSSSNRYSDQSWNDKKQWIKDQLRLLDADVVGFQEVFSVKELQQLTESVGYPYFCTVDTPARDPEYPDVFIKPVVALASRYRIDALDTVEVSETLLDELPLTMDFMFSRLPIRARIDAGDGLGEVLVYVTHLKSKRPKLDDLEYSDDVDWALRGSDTLQRLSRGHVASLLQRGAEATALYHDVSRELEFSVSQPVVLLGDLNDRANSIPIAALKMQDNIYEIGGIKQTEWPPGVKAGLYDYRLADTFDLAEGMRQQARPFTHIYRGEGDVLDYILVSNALNQKNHDSLGEVADYKVYNAHLQSDGVGNHKQSDHAQVVVDIQPRKPVANPDVSGASSEPVLTDDPLPFVAPVTESITRQAFIELAGGVYQSHKGYKDWNSQNKWSNFWQFFFDTGHGWVKSVYGAVPIDELYQKRRHSIEHIIPKSFLKDYLRKAGVAENVRQGATVNPFNFAACERGMNSYRSNFPFDMDGDKVKRPFRLDLNPDIYMTTGLDAENEWVIPSRTRGDIARALLYMTLTYGIDELYNRHLDTLVHWAKVDPPSAWELAYNEWIFNRLGIRNPFIASPEEALVLLNDRLLLESILISTDRT